MSTAELTRSVTPAPHVTRGQHPASRANLKTTSPGRCTCHCPGGDRCTLSNDVEHQLHICADSQCVCHSRDRYEGRL